MGENIMEIMEKIRQILKEVKPSVSLEGVHDIVESGYLDSFELMALISMIGDEFGVEIEVDEIVPENFNSVEAIAAMVERLKNA
jgi:acyl carrier protein